MSNAAHRPPEEFFSPVPYGPGQLREQIAQADPNNPYIPVAAHCGRGFVYSRGFFTMNALGYGVGEAAEAIVEAIPEKPKELMGVLQTLLSGVEVLGTTNMTLGVVGGVSYYLGMRHYLGRALDLRDRQIEDGLRRLIADSE